LKNLPELAVDLIAKILTPTPEKRLTPKEALNIHGCSILKK